MSNSNKPEWAKFKATDEDGKEYYYEVEPIRGSLWWDENGGRFEAVKGAREGWKGSLVAV